MTMEEFTKLDNFKAPGQGSCARSWPCKSHSENALFLRESSSLHPVIDQTI